MALVLAIIALLGLVGCQKSVRGGDVYSFPEPTRQITGIIYSQGQENTFKIGPDHFDPDDLSVLPVVKWFHSLKLKACAKPDVVEGSVSYSFHVNDEEVFTYEDRGNKAYIIIEGNCYKVSNPSVPPIN